jgi:1-deoxy-D-xylulose-5-phosphate reductoisomerase
MEETTVVKKRIALLGSTGSIGRQTLDVIRSNPGRFEVEVLTAQNNCDILIQQAIEFSPNVVVIGNPDCYSKVAEALKPLPVKVYSGEDSITQVMEMDSIDLVVSALVGYAGLRPTLRAIDYRKNIALAHKETLVIAGDIVTAKAMAMNVRLIPVDSEHSAIFQCLSGEDARTVEKIYLTASGGPFRGKTREYLHTAGWEAALKHPNWKMGHKITIDSASMMNKGLEVIEARWLFGLRPDQIDVIIHPQSIIHSMVQFTDGSMKAQMGLPDMRLPILYALGFPGRLPSDFPRLSFADYPRLTFEKPDKELFRCLDLAYKALEEGGNTPCILNAANEVAVHAFLNEKIRFLEMPDVIDYCMRSVSRIKQPAYEDYVETHRESIRKAEEFIINIQK